MAAAQTLTIDQGSKFEFTVTVWEDAVGGTLKDLTGHDARMQARDAIDSATKVLDLTSNPAAGITINIATSQITVSATALQTAAITSDLVYDLEILPTGNEAEVQRLLQGNLKLSKEVTR